MSYPKQLQLFDENYIGGDIGPGSGKREIYSNGFTPPGDVTVNILLAVINDVLHDLDLTGITNSKRTAERFRAFDTSFGDVVVYPGGVAMTSAQAANEMIEIMRVLWDIDRAVSPNSIGYATSVKN